jgi:hypothetical protein
MKLRAALACCLAATLAFVSGSPHAQHHTCSNDDAAAAERAAVGLQSWTAVYDAYRRYGQCDDGAVAEGFAGSVVKLLAVRWDQFEALHGLTLADPGFREFVMNHVYATGPEASLRVVIRNTTQRCRSEAKPLCRDIERAAQTSIREGSE